MLESKIFIGGKGHDAFQDHVLRFSLQRLCYLEWLNFGAFETVTPRGTKK
jgi:hypothetical protein